MAWPTEAAAVVSLPAAVALPPAAPVIGPGPVHPVRFLYARPTIVPAPIWRTVDSLERLVDLVRPDRARSMLVKYRRTLDGLYRVFNDAEYRFYRSNSGPPAETDTPFATSATLPATPTDTFAPGTWYLSVSYFNGVVDSGFLVLGNRGETWRRLDIEAGGSEIQEPPAPPASWRLEQRSGGVVRVVGVYFQGGTLKATEWAITYTTDGSTPGAPPAVSPDVTVAFNSDNSAIVVLNYDLPAQAKTATVKVRLQVRRNDGGDWLYSEGSDVKSTLAGVTSTDAAIGGDWIDGRLPESV